ncbi:MAG: class I SAM-dependent methyltransferase [Actinomycetota bacterium]|nr:class I SAM-dependent methyltransferase [Actinomycetota bacterium]
MKALRYTPFEHLKCPRPVDKLDWISDFCRDKRVLDLGAFDETAVALKEGTDYWLHGRIAAAAKEVVGVDNSELLPAEGLRASDQSVIVRGDILELGRIHLDWDPDVVVAGELIEHLPNALEFLRLLKADDRFASSTVLLTTPNASAFYNFVLGLGGRESTHHDHVAIHSYKTLNTLCAKVGLSEWDLIPYHSRFSELGLRSSRLVRLVVTGFERLVNAVEYLFPLVGGGWIVKARL